jgi:protein-L-isoaspartate(D-aspartate) O-methyltransferase
VEVTMTVDEYRRAYAETVASTAGVQTPALMDALASVPREAFLRPGPWVVVGEESAGRAPRQTPSGDPRFVYENVAVAIDPDRQLFNGSPAFLAKMIDRLALRSGSRVLHVGAGLGYYTAVMAHVAGPSGSVVALEIDETLAAAARTNLSTMPWVDARCADGAAIGGPFDAILVNAGVTHPQDAWLEALAPEGRLILPLTVNMPAMGPTLGKGVMAMIIRTTEGAFLAEIVSFVAIYSAIGLRDHDIEARLGQALRRTSFPNLTRLRRDAHESSPDCWLHTRSSCLSMDPV